MDQIVPNLQCPLGRLRVRLGPDFPPAPRVNTQAAAADVLLFNSHMFLRRENILKLEKFTGLLRAMKNDILIAQPAAWNPSQPPLVLPPSVASLLAGACDMSDEEVSEGWGLVHQEIWFSGVIDIEREAREHGTPHGLCMRTTLVRRCVIADILRLKHQLGTFTHPHIIV